MIARPWPCFAEALVLGGVSQYACYEGYFHQYQDQLLQAPALRSEVGGQSSGAPGLAPAACNSEPGVPATHIRGGLRLKDDALGI